MDFFLQRTEEKTKWQMFTKEIIQDMVALSYNPSTQEDEAGGSLWVWSQPGLCETLPRKKKGKKKEEEETQERSCPPWKSVEVGVLLDLGFEGWEERPGKEGKFTYKHGG